MMYSAKAGQARIDQIILTFAVILVAALIGMLANVPTLIILSVPFILAVLMFMSVLDRHNGWPDRATITVLLIFHGISLALWSTALIGLGSKNITLGGMTTSAGIITLVAWPFYALFSGPLYAFCCDRMGWARIHAHLGDAIGTPGTEDHVGTIELGTLR